MTDLLFYNRDGGLTSADAPDCVRQWSREDAERLGLPVPADGLEVPLGAVAELAVAEDGTASSRIVAEAGSAEAEAFSAELGDPDRPVELEAAPDPGAGPKAAPKPADKARRRPAAK